MTKKNIFKLLSALLTIVMLVTVFAGCAGNKAGSGDPSEISGTPHVQVTMEKGGSFVIELYPEYAPETVANFLKLVNEGFYNGLTFHRVIDGFMAQGGDPNGDGSGGSGKEIYGEFSNNGFTRNTLSHTRGVVSMARSPYSMDSASSQFFICYTDDCASLDGDYAAFGKVNEGMEVVDSFLKVERVIGGDGSESSPVEPIVMKEVKVITEGA